MGIPLANGSDAPGATSLCVNDHDYLLPIFSPDLKAFERRMTEVISHIQPTTNRWRGSFTIHLVLLPNIAIKLMAWVVYFYFYGWADHLPKTIMHYAVRP